MHAEIKFCPCPLSKRTRHLDSFGRHKFCVCEHVCIADAPVPGSRSVHAQPAGSSEPLGASTRDVLHGWVIVSGQVLGVGHWQDVVLKHRLGPYWVHATWARLDSGALELGAKVRVFLPYGHSIDAAHASLSASAVRVDEPVTWSTPLGRLDVGSATIELSSSSSLSVTVHHVGSDPHVPSALASSD